MNLRNHSAYADEKRPSSNWTGVFAITLCVFTLIASEFMPVSLLSPIALDLGITEGTAGQGMTISGIFAVLTSLLIRKLAGKMNRKYLLLLLTALMGISALIVAMAPNFSIYMLGRALIGVVIGGFWSMSVATAVRLVHISQVPRALAVFNGGNALATVVAAPLGSYLASVTSWRGAFLSLVPFAVVTFIWQWISLPSMKAGSHQAASGSGLGRLLGDRSVAIGMGAAGIFFMGQFTLFTYIRPYLELIAQVDARTISLILLAIGISGLAGTTAIGLVIKNQLYKTLMIIPLLMALIALLLIPLATNIVAVSILLALWGVLSTAAPVGWWSWVAHATKADTESGGGLMVATVQFSIAIGSTVGGILFDHLGYESTFCLSAGMLVVAALMAIQTARCSAG
ncbi:MFS transporter [Klebsiella variicola]|uniref:MFS transporter n=1 Tax=Klebsiella variicola TaxID=244366 RepID=UPI00109D186B|nr:MFS transporter [Klebsiella variicola]UDC27032.1 MFS transporter [Klebsiella variicola subsp. tropica]